MSFTIIKNCKFGYITCHRRKARLYKTDYSPFLNVPVVTCTSCQKSQFEADYSGQYR